MNAGAFWEVSFTDGVPHWVGSMHIWARDQGGGAPDELSRIQGYVVIRKNINKKQKTESSLFVLKHFGRPTTPNTNEDNILIKVNVNMYNLRIRRSRSL